jgi:uncharacterized repeat protein (TIGR03803 family)
VNCADGAGPQASLIFDTAGNLYGTTRASNNVQKGVVFELIPNPDGSCTEKVLHTFTDSPDGSLPAGLIFDTEGNLYGTTEDGGAGNGTVFKLTLNSDGGWTESLLYSFIGGHDGAFPVAGVIFDAAGNLYGTTAEGGASGYSENTRIVDRVNSENRNVFMVHLSRLFLFPGAISLSDLFERICLAEVFWESRDSPYHISMDGLAGIVLAAVGESGNGIAFGGCIGLGWCTRLSPEFPHANVNPTQAAPCS